MSMIYLVLLSFLTHPVILTAQQPEGHPPPLDTIWNSTCFDGANYTFASAYHLNLVTLLSSLTYDTKIDYGFYNMSEGQDPDRVSAIGLCRGDVKPDVCRICLKNATVNLLLDRCPSQKEALIINEGCMLQYSDKSIFGSYQNPDYFFGMCNTDTAKFDILNGTVNDLLRNLSKQAAAGDSRRKLATSNAQDLFQTPIWGLVQCTPDLSKQSCEDCLQKAISEIGEYCATNKVGARIIKLSCNVRYERYLFFDQDFVNSLQPSPPPLLPPPSASSSGNTTSSQGSSSRIVTIIVAVLAPVALIIIVLSVCWYFLMRKSKKKTIELELGDNQDEITPIESLQFDFNTIRLATDNFSVANKLGQGGFGPVYKGRLSNGKEIAVKRLSMDSGQGDSEFKNEVLLVAKLQHRNLVKLLGFCLERKERLLVYEFLPNKSLDYLLFDPNQRAHLNWGLRHKIIGGIARGLLYLHEDLRLHIIHRDLKTSNILLDDEMNPMISDFGMVRLFGVNQTQSNTSRIVGTYFGILVLVILSGKRNNTIFHEENAHDLLSFAWKNWREGTTSNIIDSILTDGSRKEMIRCIHIGLLCVQENVADRPTMASVALMLSSSSLSLPLPSQPAFLMNYRSLLEMQSRECSSGVKGSSEQYTNSIEASSG